MNNLNILGRLTSEPIQGGTTKKYVRFILAVKNTRKEDGADFIPCIAFGKTGELVEKYLHKGSRVAIEGTISSSKYEKEGSMVYSINVIVDKLSFID